MDRSRLPVALAPALVIIVLATAAYVPAMRSGYIWDDDKHVSENPAVLA